MNCDLFDEGDSACLADQGESVSLNRTKTRTALQLTREQEAAYVVQARGGDMRALEILEEHSRLAREALVRKITNLDERSAPYADAVQTAWIGFNDAIHATKAFDPSLGFRFFTFAKGHIFNRLSKEAGRNADGVRLPRGFTTEAKKMLTANPDLIDDPQQLADLLARDEGKTTKSHHHIAAIVATKGHKEYMQPISEATATATAADPMRDVIDAVTAVTKDDARYERLLKLSETSKTTLNSMDRLELLHFRMQMAAAAPHRVEELNRADLLRRLGTQPIIVHKDRRGRNVISGTMLVSPAIAKSWITPDKRRRIRSTEVAAWTQRFLADEYRTDICSIKLSEKWQALDGNHRLLGLIQSNRTILMQISVGHPVNTALCFNDSISNNFRDAFTMEGISVKEIGPAWRVMQALYDGSPTKNPRQLIESLRSREDVPLNIRKSRRALGKQLSTRPHLVAACAIVESRQPNIVAAVISALRGEKEIKPHSGASYIAKTLLQRPPGALKARIDLTRQYVMALHNEAEGKTVERLNINPKALKGYGISI